MCASQPHNAAVRATRIARPLEFAPPASCFGGRSTYIGAMFKTPYEIYWVAMFMALAVGLGLAIVEGAYQVVHYIA